MESNSVRYHKSDSKIGRLRSGSDLFISCMMMMMIFLTALLTITHVTYIKINNREEMKYICRVI